MNITQENFRSYCFIEIQRGKSATEIIQQLKESRISNIPADSTIFLWVREMKSEGRTTFLDRPRSGRPSSTNDVSVNTLKAILNDNPRQSLRDLAGETGIPKETIRRILTETLHLKKVCSVWIPHQLSQQSKEDRVSCARSLIQLIENNSQEEILRRFAVEDESWILFDTPQTKQQNKA